MHGKTLRYNGVGWAAALGAVLLGLICAAVPGGAAAAEAPAVRVWAADDCVRVNPETSRYLEDRTDIHEDYPTGRYQETSQVWEAAAGRVSLRASRNEFVAFQLVVECDVELKGVQVSVDRLVGPGGAELAGRNVALFKAWYVQVTVPSHGFEKLSLGPAWYPDALIPASPGQALAFDLPDQSNGIGPSQRNQAIWVDIYVPRDRNEAPPGRYTGSVRVCWPGGEREIAVELNVWDFALPDEIHCRGDIWNGTLNRMAPELELAYYQLARQHRFQPGVQNYRPDLVIDGRKVTIDWRSYDARLGKYLDGTAFTAEYGYWGPGYGLPIGHILLPFDCERGEGRRRAWPMATPEEGPTPDSEAVWLETGRQVKEHFEADPRWRNVERIIFLDGLDEAYYEAAYKKMAYYSELCRRAMGKGWYKFRIDGGYNWAALDFLYPYVDLWVCHTVAFNADKMAHFRERGVEPWFYGPMVYEQWANSGSGSNTYTDLDLLTCRAIGWVTWKHKCGYCEWEFDYNADVGLRKAANFEEGVSYNGSGLLIYRGDTVGRPGPIPSIRLKAHRRGFQDYEYFWLLDRAGLRGEADALVDHVVHALPFGNEAIGNTELWLNNPEEWEAARYRAGELLDGAPR